MKTFLETHFQVLSVIFLFKTDGSQKYFGLNLLSVPVDIGFTYFSLSYADRLRNGSTFP